MNSLKTPKGTVLPLINLKGKDYLQVAYRLVWFREEHSDWSLETEFVSLHETYALAKATIRDSQGRALATAHKREDAKHFADFSEKAETGAIGRALALVGYGTQFAPELDEEDRIVDSPIQRRGVYPEAPGPEDGIQSGEKYVAKAAPKTTPKGKRAPEVISRDAIVATLLGLYNPYLAKFPNANFKELLQQRYGADEVRLLTVEQCNDLAQFMAEAVREKGA